MLHADETADRIDTATCWLHVLYTLIHASVTRGTEAIVDASCHRLSGVMVHDCLALYWK